MKTTSYCTTEHCLTCGDVLLSVCVVAIYQDTNLALVEIDGQREEVDISLIEQITVGDILLVHGGVALDRQAGPGTARGRAVSVVNVERKDDEICR